MKGDFDMVDLIHNSNNMEEVIEWRETMKLVHGRYPITTAKIVNGKMILKSKITVNSYVV